MNKPTTRLFFWLLLVGVLGVVIMARRTTPAGAVAGTNHTYLPVAPHHASYLPGIDLEPLVSGVDNPSSITHAGDERLFVAEKAGRILVLDNDGNWQADPYLDITGRIDSSGEEMGLLGLAFHPGYADNGTFFVYYTNLAGDSTISRFTVRPENPQQADPDSEAIILVVEQPTIYHQAGALAFSPRDGYLYIALGDGGVSNNGQKKDTLLGKLLRLDVDQGLPYTIPPDNPFIGDPEIPAEVWSWGLRNPWRITFDRATGDLYIAEVGEAQKEEINIQPAGNPGGQNYGWACWEGTTLRQTSQCNENETYTFPAHEYTHEDTRCSITGGYVYRGQEYPALRGHYLFTDFCSGQFWSLTVKGADDWSVQELFQLFNFWGTTFGENAAGELYVGAYFGNDILWKVTVPAEEQTVTRPEP